MEALSLTPFPTFSLELVPIVSGYCVNPASLTESR